MALGVPLCGPVARATVCYSQGIQMTNRQHTAKIQATIGYHVRRLRQASGATQQEVADRCAMYRTYLSRIENGSANPTVQVLVDLAQLFGVEMASFFSTIDAPDKAESEAPALAHASPSPSVDVRNCPLARAGTQPLYEMA